MKVLMLVQTSFNGRVLRPGDRGNVSDVVAQRWFANKIAEPFMEEEVKEDNIIEETVTKVEIDEEVEEEEPKPDEEEIPVKKKKHKNR